MLKTKSVVSRLKNEKVVNGVQLYCVSGNPDNIIVLWLMIAELTRIHEKQNLSHLVSAFGESQMVESYDMTT